MSCLGRNPLQTDLLLHRPCVCSPLTSPRWLQPFRAKSSQGKNSLRTERKMGTLPGITSLPHVNCLPCYLFFSSKSLDFQSLRQPRRKNMLVEAQDLYLSLGMSDMGQGSLHRQHGRVRGGRGSQCPERARALVRIRVGLGEGSYSSGSWLGPQDGREGSKSSGRTSPSQGQRV